MARSHLLKALRPARVTGRHSRHGRSHDHTGTHSGTGSRTGTKTHG